MSVLQAYQADLLKELDEGEQVSSNNILELRRTADLALRATKEMPEPLGGPWQRRWQRRGIYG